MLKKSDGFSLLELMIVLVIIAVLVPTAVVNFGPAVVSIDIDHATSQVAATISNIHRDALKAPEGQTFTFDVSTALPNNHPGILVTTTAPASKGSCQDGCPSGSSICLSDKTFCYDNSATFSFQPACGRLTTNHAIFIISKGRKLAVLVSLSGKTDIAELVSGQWRTRTDLQTN